MNLEMLAIEDIDQGLAHHIQYEGRQDTASGCLRERLKKAIVGFEGRPAWPANMKPRVTLAQITSRSL